MTTAQELTIGELANWHAAYGSTSVRTIADPSESGAVLAVLTDDSPAPNPIIRVCSDDGRQAWPIACESDALLAVETVRTSGRLPVIVRADDVVYRVFSGGTFERTSRYIG